MKVLVDEEADVNFTDEYGRSALSWAAFYGYLDIAKVRPSASAMGNGTMTHDMTDRLLSRAEHMSMLSMTTDGVLFIKQPTVETTRLQRLACVCLVCLATGNLSTDSGSQWC